MDAFCNDTIVDIMYVRPVTNVIAKYMQLCEICGLIFDKLHCMPASIEIPNHICILFAAF